MKYITLLALFIAIDVRAMPTVCLDHIKYYKENKDDWTFDQGYGYGYFGVKYDPKTLKPERCNKDKPISLKRPDNDYLEQLLRMRNED